MKGEPIRDKAEALKHRKARGTYMKIAENCIKEFLEAEKEGYEGYSWTFDPDEVREMRKIYDAIRNLITTRNPALKDLVVTRKSRSRTIWIYRKT